jgi:hypothetical protein
VPTRDEQVSIFPSDQTYLKGSDIYSSTSGTLADPDEFSEVACNVGGTDVAASTSIFAKSGSDLYAIRFIGTPYASAWHYKWVTSPCNGMLIESYLLDNVSTLAEAKTEMAKTGFSTTLFSDTYGNAGANQTPANSTATMNGFVQRFLPACGGISNEGSISGTAIHNVGIRGFYWSSSVGAAPNGFNWRFLNSGGLHEDLGPLADSRSVRLFKNRNFPPAQAVDLGIVVNGRTILFANKNVGAEFETDYGGYYCWAGTTDVTNTSINLAWNSNCPYWKSGSNTSAKFSKYVPTGKTSYWDGSGSTPDNKTTLDLEDDAARVNMGGSWRMPTKAELTALTNINNCTWTWYDNYNSSGVAGYLVTSNKTGYTSNSIFLPVAGRRGGTDFESVGEKGYYWSSSIDTDSPQYGWFLNLSSSNISMSYSGRPNGNPVRAVQTAPPSYTVVDLGLSVKWASMNIGAESETDYGTYFAWGETTGLTVVGASNTFDNENTTKTDYSSWSIYKWSAGSKDGTQFSKYVPSGQTSNWGGSGSTPDNKTTLELADDAARVNWGGHWRMPTEAEWNELQNTDNCTWTWKSNYNSSGVNGYLVTSKKTGYTNNSIFLPAGGRRDAVFQHQGSWGFYWSSSLNTTNPAISMFAYLNSSTVSRDASHRLNGFTVRAVY